ncbi:MULTISPECIES: HlyD family efflux transporter periplasmic adaptor subunit [unclassified Actinotalea]|uniref:HlyD family efflux transporter periplasmic adaptor subunit n=1 Tax=unclassified Actinotalea TaxID=2638618 RepID=UPI0015F5B19B|nr:MULTISPECIES: HlyD family efflux transporter periplasmic adaptor subunit [unclassified Actinotalea]
MTWGARLRLLVGLVLVLALAAWLTIHLNDRRGEATSTSASIHTRTYDVGSSYAGLVVTQEVEVGDAVTQGQPLFVVDSAALRHDLLIGLVSPDVPGSGIAADGTLTVTAAADGVVSELAASRGTFVQAGTRMATVDTDGTLTVQAEFTLTPEQFARVEDRAPVSIRLPDGTTLDGSVDEVDATTAAGQAQAVVTVASAGLVRGDADGLVAPGTPVTAVLTLDNDGLVSTVAESVEREVGELVTRWWP